MSPGKPSSTGAGGRRAKVDHQTRSSPWGIVSQAITKIEDQPFIFVIAVIVLLVILELAAAKLGSPDLSFIVHVIAVLAITAIVGYYLKDVLSSRGKSSEAAVSAVTTSGSGESGEPAKPDVIPAVGVRSNKYDRWQDELSNGFAEVTLAPGNAVERNTLARILERVLGEKKFSETVAGNAHVVLDELLNNVAKHVRNSDANVMLELNTGHLPTVMVTVGDEGKGYQWWERVKQQYLEMKTDGREHGVGRICRLSDRVLSTPSASSNPWFRVECTLHDISWPGSLCDEYGWCEKVILDYTPPASVWFGSRKHSRRYSLWWEHRYGGPSTLWSVLGALNFSIDEEIPQIANLYLEHMRAKEHPYLFFEIRRPGSTETGDPRTSSETISQTLESYFKQQFADRKVLLYASKHAYPHALESLSENYGLQLFTADAECEAALRKIDDRMSSSRSRPV